jgi:hypothetical protein
MSVLFTTEAQFIDRHTQFLPEFSRSSLSLTTVWSDNPGYLMLTKRPASAIGGLYSVSKTREYVTHNLVFESLSNSLCSSLSLATVWSDNLSYLMLTKRPTSAIGGLHSISEMSKIKKLSPLQDVEAYRVVRC